MSQRTRPAFWAHKNLYSRVLYLPSVLFVALVRLRKLAYRKQWLKSRAASAPGKVEAKVLTIVVGNITVGGAGKTPLVIALSELLDKCGYRVGIVTRGYGGKNTDTAKLVSKETTALEVGDEALLLARRTERPVVCCKNRVHAVRHLLEIQDIDIILSDDGLQHYALRRDLEIAVVDTEYRFGNGYCLPAGPLREPVSRLSEVDMVVYSGHNRCEPGYSLVGDTAFSFGTEMASRPLKMFAETKVHAVAGIASPSNFFTHLTACGLDVIEHAFEDHAVFKQVDLQFGDNLPVIMTEKDMVKCTGFDCSNCWYVPVHAELDRKIVDDFLNKVHRLSGDATNVS